MCHNFIDFELKLFIAGNTYCVKFRDEIYAENEDVFVHYRAIMGDGYKSLNEGEEVEFLQTRSEKGWQAAEVERTATNSVGQDESAVEYENELDAV